MITHKIRPGFDKAGAGTRCLGATGHRNIKNSGLGLLVLLAVVLSPCISPCTSQAQVQLLHSGADGLTLKSTAPQYQLGRDSLGVQHMQAAAPFATLHEPGRPQLLQWSAALAAPPGAVLRLKVDAGAYREIEGIDLGLFDPSPNDKHQSTNLQTDAEGFWPAQRADTAYLGSLRGTPSHSLRLFPFSYNIARRTLRVYESLQVRVDFEGGGAAKAAGNADPHSAALRAGPRGLPGSIRMRFSAWPTPFATRSAMVAESVSVQPRLAALR